MAELLHLLSTLEHATEGNELLFDWAPRNTKQQYTTLHYDSEFSAFIGWRFRNNVHNILHVTIEL